ncbi:chaperonin-like protein [Aureococcus anophagefferens]|uniref:Chaperonin-like protein n=1 Tax=Aureococcus anophagefferens TaxID=44056 RepID=A0ABR1FS17_AURAN
MYDGNKVTISNDGATIMKLLDIVHPAARVLAEISMSQDSEVGDGTTSVVLLAGEMLKQVKPFAIAVTPPEAMRRKRLEILAGTALNSKLIANYKDLFAPMVATRSWRWTRRFDLKLVGVKKVPGGSVTDSFAVQGVAFKKTFSYAGFEQMTKSFENCKVLCLNAELELKSEKENAEVRISDPDDYQSIVDAEWQIIYDKLDFCYFADRGLFCAGRVPDQDMERVVKATGAVTQTSVLDLAARRPRRARALRGEAGHHGRGDLGARVEQGQLDLRGVGEAACLILKIDETVRNPRSQDPGAADKSGVSLQQQQQRTSAAMGGRGMAGMMTAHGGHGGGVNSVAKRGAEKVAMAAMEVADVLQLADRPWQEISTVRLPAATPPREACDVDDAPGCDFSCLLKAGAPFSDVSVDGRPLHALFVDGAGDDVAAAYGAALAPPRAREKRFERARRDARRRRGARRRRTAPGRLRPLLRGRGRARAPLRALGPRAAAGA